MKRFNFAVTFIISLMLVAGCSENPMADSSDSNSSDFRYRIDESGDYLTADELATMADEYIANLNIEETAKGRPSIEMATGSGHLHDTRLDAPNFRTFAFVAIEKDDSETVGQWELYSRGAGVRMHGIVECLEVAGNMAWFAGRTTESTKADEVGKIRGFRVIDEGSGPFVDKVSLTPAYNSASLFCDAKLALDLLQVENGNLTVH